MARVLPRAQRGWLALVWGVLIAVQIAQPYPRDALLQHMPTALALLAASALLRRWPLSDSAVACLGLFLVLHSVGGRYAYSNVPYDAWWRALTGGTLSAAMGWTRNHYDRLVHLSFGLLWLWPMAEVAMRRGVGRRASLALAVTVVAALSAGYEVFEWLLTLLVAGEAATRYNGQQGDPWDAQRDMALAIAGAIAVAALLWRRGRGACTDATGA